MMLLVKIKKTAICGTDIHIYNWDEWAQKTIPIPMITGHEYAGEIVELGSNVYDLKDWGYSIWRGTYYLWSMSQLP